MGGQKEARTSAAPHPGTAEPDAGLSVAVLGPFEVRLDGQPVTVTGRLRALLAMLAISADRSVTVTELTGAVWGQHPPANARRSLSTYVTRLRALLGMDAIVTRPNGYRLAVEPDRVDALRFLRLVDAAAQEPDADAQRSRLVQALTLWRGAPFQDVPSPWLAQSEASRLVERHLLALERRIDLDLARHLHGDLVAELTELTARHPLRESLWVRLLVVLTRCGRPAEALTAYETVRARLAAELGTDPSPELQDVFTALLRGQQPVVTTVPDPTGTDAGPRRTVPRQLPADPAAFTGRADELRALDALLPGTRGPRPAAIAVVHGGAGIGKTSLAVHWAHRVARDFPDGQLYVNLRGWASAPPVHPARALAGFLVALGEPAERVPTDVDEAAALYRTLLADRRMLVLLDNARDIEQVRPLLPASPGGVTLVTSRDRLSGLVVREGAQRIALGVLSAAEAEALLVDILPADRVRAEPEALAGLARSCGYLPLALRIASANLVDRPTRRIAEYVIELEEGDRLGALRVEGDDQSVVRAAFDLSYAALDPGAQTMFRRLGLVVAHDVTPAAAAALAGTTTDRAGELLERLAAAALVDEHGPRRYGCHDLIRLYATRSVERDPVQDREAARARYLDWCLRGVDAAARVLYPNLLRLSPERAEPPAFRDGAEAMAWLDAERANLVAVVAHTAKHGPQSVAWRLADGLRGYFWRRVSPVDWQTVAEAGVAAADADGDARARAACHLNLADLYRRRSRYADAVEQLTIAQKLSATSGWLAGQAAADGALSGVYWMRGDLPAAAGHARSALAVNRRLGLVTGQSANLGTLGMIYWTMGRLQEAAQCHEQALALDRAAGNRVNESHALGNLGETYHALGRLADALDHLERALELRTALGDRGGESEAHNILAALHRDRGDLAAAHRCATTALAIARDTGEPRLEADALNTLGTTCSRRGDAADAVTYHRRALALAQETRTTSTEAAALIGLAEAHQRTGPGEDALRFADQALALARGARHRVTEGQALTTRAEVYHAQGRHAEAMADARAGLDVHDETGHRPGAVRALLVLAGASRASGATDAAAGHRRRAAQMLADMGVADDPTDPGR